MTFSGARASAASSGAWAWGAGEHGQLGNGREGREGLGESLGFEDIRDTPVAVGGLGGAEAISVQGSDGLALLEDGTVLAWGENGSGQLGNGSEGEPGDLPVPVRGLSGVTAVASGGTHSLALLNDGTVEAWGDDEHGQLGNGSEGEPSDLPVPVQGLSDVTAISAGRGYSLVALRKNGTVMAWGEGELGDGVPGEWQSSDVPVAVCAVGETAPCAQELSGVRSITAGWSHSLALLEDGTVVAWGWNGQGELGDGHEENESADAPVAVSGLNEITAIADNGWHSLALRRNGTVMTWGDDQYGELGDGEAGFYDDRDVPVAVTGLSGVTAIATGQEDSLVLTEGAATIPTIATVQPDHGPVPGGTQVTITGTGFIGATEVTFGAKAAASFTVNSDDSITAVSPPGAPGTVDVGVAVPDALSVLGPGEDQFTYAAPAIESGSESNITEHGVTLEALINPDGFETQYELLLECAQCTSPQRVGLGHIATSHSGTAVSVELSDLESGSSYKYWVVATNSEGTTTGRVLNFTAGSPPRGPVTETGGSSGVTDSEARIKGKINPEGENATYFFEYGTSTAYGKTAPITPGRIENGECGLCETNTPQPVSAKLTELEPGTVYHYRLVATSGPGYRRYGKDATFTPQAPHARPLGGEETPSSTGVNDQSGTSGTSSGSGGSSSTPAVMPLIAPLVSIIKPKPVTRTEKLGKALNQCKKDKSKRKRAACEKQARKHYGTVANKNKKR